MDYNEYCGTMGLLKFSFLEDKKVKVQLGWSWLLSKETLEIVGVYVSSCIEAHLEAYV